MMLCRPLAWTLAVLTFVSAGPVPDVKDEGLKLALRIPDNESGTKVAQWNANMNMNPEELGNYLEGDIMVSESTSRNGAKDPNLRWPNRIIPYVIQGNFNNAQLNLIKDAMNEYQKHTCLRLVPRTNEKDYVKIVSENTGCWSYVGKVGGEQIINLQIPGCVTIRGTVIHEIMHAVGFWHEQSRDDRDKYVTINWNNIIESTKSNFAVLSSDQVADYGVGYDYNSVMHYSAYAFAKDPFVKTIIPKDSNARIGQREGFSLSDYTKINRMYKC